MLSVRTVAYSTKPARKSKEKSSSQSMPLVRTLGKGPAQSASVTTTSLLASMPENETTRLALAISAGCREAGSVGALVLSSD